MKQKFIIIIALCSMFALGYSLRQPPASILFVQFINESTQDVLRIDIQHGNSDTEEKITLHRLAKNAHRTISLNHEPGLGYALSILFVNGEKIEVCGGRGIKAQLISEVIRDNELETLGGRY